MFNNELTYHTAISMKIGFAEKNRTHTHTHNTIFTHTRTQQRHRQTRRVTHNVENKS